LDGYSFPCTPALAFYKLQEIEREGVPIASGTTRQEVEQAVQRIVPKHKLPFIYTFQVKGAAHRRGAKRSEAP
jgi:hypothetical protein